jgi:cobalt-precorrin-5B (C1)-methyltransferase
VPDFVDCVLPNTQRVRFAITGGWTDGRRARAVSIKDAGDDPDATNGAHLTAEVERLPGAAGGSSCAAGRGRRGHQAGLGLEVGGPAINPVPRRNIHDNVRGRRPAHPRGRRRLAVTISVPGGDEMAKKTLNARLGILGGISILGTTGIVRPYSTAAFRASVVQAVDVAANQGQPAWCSPPAGAPKMRHALLPGSTKPASCRWATSSRPPSRPRSSSMQHIIVGAMVGKLTKIAQGLSVTHAWREEVDRELIAEAAAEVGAPPDLVEEIRAAETARFAAERLAELGLAVAFHRALAERAIRSLRQRYPGPHRLTVLACNFEGVPIVTVEEHELA